MVKKSKLKMALAADKGKDFQKLHQKKVRKEAEKISRRKAGDDEEDEDEDEDEELDEEEWEDEDDEDDEEEEEEEEDEEMGGTTLDLAALDDSDTSDSSVDFEERRKPVKKGVKAASKKEEKEDDDEDEEEEEEEEEDIPISDLEDLDDEEKEDLIPHTKLTINNTAALLAAVKRIALPTGSAVPFATHQSLTSDTPTAASIPDVSDDLKRELAFYGQCLDAAKRGRKLLKAEGVPFSRPGDYFAEMVKDDGHMQKVKEKLIEEATAKKAAAEARKQRDLKKFGKQVQIAKQQEREKEKKQTLDKIKVLKRKRQDNGNDATNEADMFDVALEDETRDNKRGRRDRAGGKSSGNGSGGPNVKRQKKDAKYGFGGRKKFSKSGDAASSADMRSFSVKKMKGKTTARPGKSRRKAAAGRH